MDLSTAAQMKLILASTKIKAQNEKDKQNMLKLMNQYKKYKSSYARNIKFDPAADKLSNKNIVL